MYVYIHTHIKGAFESASTIPRPKPIDRQISVLSTPSTVCVYVRRENNSNVLYSYHAIRQDSSSEEVVVNEVLVAALAGGACPYLFASTVL